MASIYSLPEFRHKRDGVKPFPILDYDEEERLFAAIRKRSEDAFRLSNFLLDTGCHLSEALRLTWDDVQVGRVRFCMTRTIAARTIPLTERASAAVGTPERESAGPFAMLCETSFLTVWNEARTEVGFGADNQVVPIVLRHSCASRLVEGGIDLRRVQVWLGHKSLAETMRYSVHADEALDPCLDVLESRPIR